MHARDRVKQLAARGKTPGDLHARLCDVATAVEILAGGLKDVPQSAQVATDALKSISSPTPGQTAFDAWPETGKYATQWSNLNTDEQREWEAIASAVIDKHGVIVDDLENKCGIIANQRSMMIRRNKDGACWFRIDVRAPDGNPYTNGAHGKLDLLDSIARMLGLATDVCEATETRCTDVNTSTEPNAAPQPSLVERLKKAYVFAEMEAIAGGGDPVDMGVRAILASLSKTPVAMMTADHIATLCGGEDYSPTDRRYARSAVQAFQEFVAPILAANDARIQELESLHAGSMRSLRKQFEFAPQDGDANTGKWILRADVLNAIDAQVSAANVVAGERLETIELQRKRTVDLEAQIAGLERDRRHCVDAITESNLVPPGRTLLEGIGELVRLHRRAKKRLAELETRVAVVTRQRDDEHGLSNLRSYEIDTWKKELADARARIAELEASGAATAEGLQAALNMATQTALDNVKDKLQRTEQDLGVKNDRVAELERQLAAACRDIEAHVTQARCAVVRLGHPDKTLEDAVRAVEQQKMLDGIAAKEAKRGQRADVEPDWVVERVRSAIKSSYDDLELIKGPSLAVSFRDMAECAIAELRRIDKEREPLTVDGKTPGQVAYEAFRGCVMNQHETEAAKKWEIAARAVLRAFGNQGGQTPTTNAVEALDKLASYWEKGAVYEGMPEQYRRGLTDCAKELREELTKLEGAKSTPTNEPPTFVASKDVVRGSYFRTAISLRPYLHVGRDIEFDDIPRLLKLGRNDVIEIRVVQRAKQ